VTDHSSQENSVGAGANVGVSVGAGANVGVSAGANVGVSAGASAGAGRVDASGAATGLSATFTATQGTFTLDVALEVEPGRPLALLGPNGSGKTTAINALAGLVPLTSGSITVGGRVLEDAASGAFVPPEQRQVGVVFQNYLLFPHLSVLENVAFGLRARRSAGAISRIASRSALRSEARSTASDWLERLGIAELASRKPAELSGGQAQRVALARALAIEPDVLLLDEPLAALDVEVREQVREELAGHIEQFRGVTIVVTHSFADVAALARDVAVLERGRVSQRGSVREIVNAPATPWIQRLVDNWSADGLAD
jgi:molybdate transport system ATP-binding protein